MTNSNKNRTMRRITAGHTRQASLISSFIARITAILLVLVIVQGCTQTTAPKDTTADVEAIRAFISRATEINRAGDAEAWADLFAKGAILMPLGEPEVTTRQGMVEYAKKTFDKFDLNLSITPVEIEVFGDWAFARTAITGTFTPKTGGKSVQANLKEIALYRRQSDGSWKLWRLIGNDSVSGHYSDEMEVK